MCSISIPILLWHLDGVIKIYLLLLIIVVIVGLFILDIIVGHVTRLNIKSLHR